MLNYITWVDSIPSKGGTSWGLEFNILQTCDSLEGKSADDLQSYMVKLLPNKIFRSILQNIDYLLNL